MFAIHVGKKDQTHNMIICLRLICTLLGSTEIMFQALYVGGKAEILVIQATKLS